MTFKKQVSWLLPVMLIMLTFMAAAQEKSKAKTGEEMEIVGLGFEKKVVSGAEIIRASLTGLNGPGMAAAQTKGQIEIKLKSRIMTDSQGNFVLEIPKEQFKKIPDNSVFELTLKLKPPKNFEGFYSSDEVRTKLKKQNNPRYELVLFWVKDRTKTNKGTFAVSSKAQT